MSNLSPAQIREVRSVLTKMVTALERAYANKKPLPKLAKGTSRDCALIVAQATLYATITASRERVADHACLAMVVGECIEEHYRKHPDSNAAVRKVVLGSLKKWLAENPLAH